jgi:hypothetical protein
LAWGVGLIIDRITGLNGIDGMTARLRVMRSGQESVFDSVDLIHPVIVFESSR